MPYIESVRALEILDSRGNPTVQVTIITDEGLIGVASVPSGASTGSNEAAELRDGDQERFCGKGVEKAVDNVNGPIAEILLGQYATDQSSLDLQMKTLDGTDNKSRFGANAILGASLALARVGALTVDLPLYKYIGGSNAHILPCPMMNIINGGAHADNSLDFQEFMIRPINAPDFSEALRFGAEVFHALKALLKSEGHITAVGDEGGFAPNLSSNEAAIEIILKAIEKAGFKPGEDITIALDCAASEFFDKTTSTYIEKKKKNKKQDFLQRTSEEQVAYYEELCSKYPIDSIEDGLDENDWKGWEYMTSRLKHIQVVGDDIFVTNPKFLRKGIEQGVANSILVKLNQIGTLTETLETIRIAQSNHYSTIISHRSGETEDTFIADLAVAVNSGQIKTGSLSRSDRVAKYNRLLNIEAELTFTSTFYDND